MNRSLWGFVSFFIWLFLIITRLRDRLRCPNCRAVGTYKLHAPKPRWRWLCKYCGYYRDSDGVRYCVPSATYGCWIFLNQKDGHKGITPLFAVMEQSQRDWAEAHGGKEHDEEDGYTIWPWRG